MPLLQEWFAEELPEGAPENLRIYREKDGARDLVLEALKATVRSHFVDAAILEKLSFPVAAAVLRARVPTGVRTQSGDLGEILGTEYIGEYTGYRVPIKRLRHKDDRDLAMRGDDIVAFRREGGRTQVLKAEAKSRAALSTGVVKEACDALGKHDSRPNPSTLSFIAVRLREQGRDEEASLVESVLTNSVADRDLEHMVFTLSGNDPTRHLRTHARSRIRRRLSGVVIADHQEFIRSIFADLHAPAT